MWKTRTSIKHGEEEPQDRKDERNAIQPYKNTFTPVRSPNRHDKVQATITDYIRDDTPEWYAEVDRVATLIEERARCARRKRDQTVAQNAQGNPQRQLTQQTLTGSTHKKKKISAQQTEKTKKMVTSWKTQYINGNGQVTPLPPGGVKPGTINRKRGREKVVQKVTTHKIKSEWYWKREGHKLQQCNICEQDETDKENVLLSCAYCNNNTHENCDDRPLTEEQKLGTHINAHIARKNTNTQP